MARPRKPTAMLELSGAYKINPARKRAREFEPIPTGPIGPASNTLDELAAAIWDEMAAAGFWLTDADRFMLEIAAVLMSDFRLGRFEIKDHAVLVNTLNKLGFGPAERSKIKAPGAKEDSDKPKGFERFNAAR
jgi:hypothetical protein